MSQTRRLRPPGEFTEGSSRLEALRRVDLIMSRWSHERPGGKKVNYHGLGIRFWRDFGSRGTIVYVDGKEASIEDALGSLPREAAPRHTA